MRNFWCFYNNGKYKVVCSGSAIYIYDENDNELARFKDLTCVYSGAFQPNKNKFVAKSSLGSFAVYDLDKLQLIKVVVLDGGEDGFAFTPNGKYFYNIEKSLNSLSSKLVVYDTVNYKVIDSYFNEDDSLKLDIIEFDTSNNCYILGYKMNLKGIFKHGFIGIFKDGKIINQKFMNSKRYKNILYFKKVNNNEPTKKYIERNYTEKYNKEKWTTLSEEYFKL